MKNIFGINVGGQKVSTSGVADQINDSVIYGGADVSGIIRYILLGLLIFGTIGITYYLLLERKKKIGLQKSEEKFWMNIK